MAALSRFLLATSLLALAACSSGGNGDSKPVVPNALGYSVSVDKEGSGDAFDAEDTTARVTRDGDGAFDVVILEGVDAGTQRRFLVNGSSSAQGGGDPEDRAESYMVYRSYEGEPLVSVIAAKDLRESDNLGIYALRAADGLTSNMPVAGKATYSGSQFGIGRRHGGAYKSTEGAFSADVDFADGSLQGKMVASDLDISFDGAISGAEFSADPGSIRAVRNNEGAIIGSGVAPAVGHVTAGAIGAVVGGTIPGGAIGAGGHDPQPSVPAGLINQSESRIEGGFYGDDAAVMAGTYALSGAGSETGTDMIGAFTGLK